MEIVNDTGRFGYLELSDDGQDSFTYVGFRPHELRLLVQALELAMQEDDRSNPANAAWFEMAASLLVQHQRGWRRLGVDPTTLGLAEPHTAD